MPDLNTSDQQSNSGQQDGGQDNWKARFDGQVRTIQQLTLENRRLIDELANMTSLKEQLASQLTVKDAEKLAAVGERDKRLQETVTAKSALETENSELRALKLKLDVAKKLGRPELMQVMDAIPNMTDAAALETVLTTFAQFTDSQVKAREKQLLAGITPGVAAGAVNAPTMPTSEADWTKYIESKPLGSPERKAAMDAQWDFMMKQGA